MVAYVVCQMTIESQVKIYRHLLQSIQEKVKRDGKVPMTMWLYDMNVKLFLANRSEYENVSLEEHKVNVFGFKDRGVWDTTLAALPEYQAAFRQGQQGPGVHPQKKEEERPKATLTKAEELVLQNTNQNKSFIEKSKAVAKNKNAGKEHWPTAKGGQKKPSGEGHKLYGDDGLELTGKDKKAAYADWHKNGKNSEEASGQKKMGCR